MKYYSATKNNETYSATYRKIDKTEGNDVVQN